MKPVQMYRPAFASRCFAAWLMAMFMAAASQQAIAQQAIPSKPAAPTSTASHPTRTGDGREFSKLTETEVDALPDSDFDAYHKWKIRLKEAELARMEAESARKSEELARMEAESARMSEEIARRIKDLLQDFDGKIRIYKALDSLHKQSKLNSQQAEVYFQLRRFYRQVLRENTFPEINKALEPHRELFE